MPLVMHKPLKMSKMNTFKVIVQRTFEFMFKMRLVYKIEIHIGVGVNSLKVFE